MLLMHIADQVFHIHTDRLGQDPYHEAIQMLDPVESSDPVKSIRELYRPTDQATHPLLIDLHMPELEQL